MKRPVFLVATLLLAFQVGECQTCPPGTQPTVWGITRDASSGTDREVICVDGDGRLLATLTQLNGVRFADQFPGADWAAKVNAADADIGEGVPGVIYVSSSLAGLASTTLTPSDDRRIVFMGGTFASTASPNVLIDGSGVVIEGSGEGSTATGTTFRNEGSGDSFVVGSPDRTPRRGITLRGLRIVGSASSGKGIVFRANLGNVRAEDVFISTPNGWGVDGTAGIYMLVDLRHVRVDSAKEFAFNFACSLPSGPVSFNETYANQARGATSVGYNLANGQFSLFGTAADSNTRGYRLGAHVSMFGTASERNSVYGVQVVGGGTITIAGHFSGADGTPFEIGGTGAHVQIINPRTIATTEPYSIVVASTARGDNAVYGTAGLDKPIYVKPGGILQQISSRGNQFAEKNGASTVVTSSTALPFSATPDFDASLGSIQKFVLSGNVTRSSLSNGKSGQWLHFIICQDAVGSRKFSWPPNFHGAMKIGGKASTCSVQGFVFDGKDAWAAGKGVANQ